jgi:hypothetical protein
VKVEREGREMSKKTMDVVKVIGPGSVQDIILGSGGRFLTVCFRKRTTGELREMTCRTGVRKGVKGVGMAFTPEQRNLVVVWDVEKRGFRMITLDEVIWVRDGKQQFTVDRLAV